MIIQKARGLVEAISTFLINYLSYAIKITMNALLGSIIMLYVMFCFLIMGDKFLDRILYFLPLKDKDEQLLLQRLTSVTKATIMGNLWYCFQRLLA